MPLCGANAFFDEIPSDNAYFIDSYSLLITSSGTPKVVQRIKNPSDPKNSESEGVGILNRPVKTSFFFYLAGFIFI